MKTNPKPLPIMTLHYDRNKINLSDERFQRGPVWNKKQEQLLIDTILRKLDIPKIYFWTLKETDDYKYSVVDGQQRLTTIWRYLNNEFKLSNEFSPDFGEKKFDDLTMEQKNIFFSYPLTIVEIEEATLDDIRDLFLRLQNGTTLKAAEKRVNLGGSLSEYIVRKSKHEVFEIVPFKSTHRDYEQILSQCMMLELNYGPANTQNKFLNQMYLDEKEFDQKGNVAKKFNRVLDYMSNAFDDVTPELQKFNFISLYLLISQTIDTLVIPDPNYYKDFIIKFWQDRNHNRKKRQEDPDFEGYPEFNDFDYAISSRTDSLESIKSRHEIFSKYFLNLYPEIITKDNNRNFSTEQRLTIYRRDKNICWHCLKHVDWVDFEADHRPVPHSKGGETKVKNGVCAHKTCNIRASNKENIQKGWLSNQ